MSKGKPSAGASRAPENVKNHIRPVAAPANLLERLDRQTLQASLDAWSLPMVYLTVGGQYYLFNAAFSDLIGAKTAEISGGSAFTPVGSRGFCLEKASFDQSLGGITTMSESPPMADGQGRVFEFQYMPFMVAGQVAGVLVGGVDVTAQNIALEQSYRNRKALDNLIEMIPYGITWTDLEGIVRLTNPAYNRILGYEPGELTGSKVWDVLAEEQKSPQKEFNDSLLEEFPTPLPNITQCKAKDGSIIDVLFHWMYEKDENGRVKGFISVMTDVTEQLKNETRLRDSKEVAERANREKSRFLAAASHDLQQPLHSLAILLGLLQRPSSSEKRQEIVGTMGRALDGSMALLRTVLDISKLEAGVITPRLEDFNLGSCFDQIEAELGPQLEGRPVAFRIVNTSLLVRSDRMLLKSITHNLVSNAIRYTSAGKILVGCRRRGDKVRVEVWDTGRGIPKEKQTEIFQEFKRLDGPEGAKDVYALGLGLSIVERTCQLLGTKINLRSEPGKGAVFYFDLPLVGVVIKPAKDEKLRLDSPLSQLNILEGKKILLIEDDFSTLAHTDMLLQSWGCQCMAVESLFQAMGEISTRTPDLILTDYHLGSDVTGVMAADKIRESCRKDMPVIVITTDVSQHILAEAGERGYSVLEKPASPGRLRALLTHYLQED